MTTSLVRQLRRAVASPAAASLTVPARRKRTRAVRTELFPRRLDLPESGYVPTLSPADIARLLSANETAMSMPVRGASAVRGFESNQLASNYPIEDRLAIARHRGDGSLYAVIDGHGGSACAQVLSERLLDYVAATLLTHAKLETCADELRDSPCRAALLHLHRFSHAYSVERLVPLYRTSLLRFLDERLSTDGFDEFDTAADDGERVARAMTEAFLRLDNDLSTEALPSDGLFNSDTLQVAYSGACACVAHISGRDLVVANVGDVRAVLGRATADGGWTATPLSADQTAGNPDEAARVCTAHPSSESGSILRHGRLLGQLVPLRAFGDVRFKWSRADLARLSLATDGNNVIPSRYYTPPYLTAEPVVCTHRLRPGDRFVVLASDGLWDTLSSERVVQMVGEYLEAGAVARSYSAPAGARLADVNAALRQRKAGLARKITDRNVATHLLRQALGGQHAAVSQLLMLPPDLVRSYRDDISIVVVHFDQQFLQRDDDADMN